MKIVVIGGTGLIGSKLVAKLAAHRTDDAAAESTAVSGGAYEGTQPADAQSVAPEQSALGPAAQFSATARARPALDVRRLRHPSEPSRFALAASAAILLVGSGLLIVLRLTGILGLAAIGVTLLMTLGLFCWALQVHRAKLLGGAARVTPETFPILSMTAGEVKQQVGYTQPVEIFIVAEADAPVRLTSFFGTRVLLMKGDLVAELVKPGNRPQLDFILATFFGKLKVKALAWAPLLIAIDALGLPRVLNFLIAPWERATVYTGDQVAAACCGSLDESIIALNRLLVGKDLARSVGMTGLMNQAASVRRRWLPRLQQLYSSYPHLTNRYLNLLSFAGQSVPGQARAFRDRLHPTTDFRVQDVSARLTRLRKRGPRRWPPAASIAASGALLGLAAFGIFLVPQNDLVPVANIWWGSMPWVVEPHRGQQLPRRPLPSHPHRRRRPAIRSPYWSRTHRLPSQAHAVPLPPDGNARPGRSDYVRTHRRVRARQRAVLPICKYSRHERRIQRRRPWGNRERDVRSGGSARNVQLQYGPRPWPRLVGVLLLCRQRGPDDLDRHKAGHSHCGE
jgi:hypothetical protein